MIECSCLRVNTKMLDEAIADVADEVKGKPSACQVGKVWACLKEKHDLELRKRGRSCKTACNDAIAEKIAQALE